MTATKKTTLADASLRAKIDAIAKKIMANPNADGWVRLCEILKKAKQDKRIASSGGASDFLELMLEIAADSLTAANEREALKPLAKALKSEEQSDFGKNKRGKVKSDDVKGETIGDIIGLLAKSFEHSEEGAKELWMPFYAALQERHLNPELVGDDTIVYTNANGKRKPITYGHFADTVSDYRTGKK